ncbi:MAG: histidine kinase [Bacteroidota bacterium]|nr:histidine kinase [Bacteroidota bacterium]
MINRILFFYLPLLLIPAIANTQPYYFRHYQVENGLSNNAVICSLQDKKGFLWFGTKDGLNRFDGYSFKVFRNNPLKTGSIGNNFIHCLLEDKNERLWIGTESGLYRYDAINEKFYRLPFNEIGIVREMQIDHKGNLWFISNFILYCYNTTSGKLITYLSAKYFEATSVCITKNDSIWVSSPNGTLYKLIQPEQHFVGYNMFTHSPPAVSTWIEKIYANTKGDILLATNQGVKLFNIKNTSYKDLLTYNNDGTEIFARNFLETNPDECWIATETGVYIYHFKTKTYTNLSKRYNDPYSISDNAVYNICEDKEGGIWIGTYFGGVSYLANHKISFRKYFPITGQNSLSGNVVREIHEDKLGRLWIGTEDGGLNRMDKTTGNFICFRPTGKKDDISYTNIHGLLLHDNELWIGTFEHGLDIMNIYTGKIVRHYLKGSISGLNSNFIYTIYQTSDNEILIGTTTGAYRYNKASDHFSLIEGLPPVNWYSALYKDEKGILWAGTYGNGVHYYDAVHKKFQNFRYQSNNLSSISSDRINYIFQDSKKELWFATEDGLCKYLPATNNFKRYGTNNGFPSNFILSILEDDHRDLWISTTKGLVKFNPVSEAIEIYSKEKGLLNDQFNFNSAFKDREGRMYFGSVKGFISFNPNENKTIHFHPRIYFTDFQVNNQPLEIDVPNSPLHKSISFTQKIELKYNQSTFSIDFSALSYTAPEMFGYMYKMQGLPNDWTHLKSNRKVFFTELSPGNYTFMVKEAGNTANEQTPVTSLDITIYPPWWLSVTAKFIYLIIICVMIYFTIREYHYRLKEKNNRKLQQLELQKNKELYEAKMDFFTKITHEIKTPLTLIKGPLEKIIRKSADAPSDIKKSLAIMERNTERLVNLTNQILDFRQAELKGFSLNFAEVNISELLKASLESFKVLAQQNRISFHTSRIPQNIIAFIDVDAFEKILNNLLSNAIKYASSKIMIEIMPLDEAVTTFTIEIKNDGHLIPFEQKEKIFEPFFRLRETEKTKGSGIGLALAKSLAELHKGKLELKEPENGMNIFSLTIPLHQ